MARRTIQGRHFSWHHITGLDADDLGYLKENFKFHSLDFEDLQTNNPIPKLDIYKHYFFAVFQVPRWDKSFRIVTDDLEVFLGQEYLVTIARRPIDSLERYVSRVVHNPKLRSKVMGRTTGYLLYNVVRYVYHQVQSVVTELATQMNTVEEEVYEHQNKHTTRKLALIRRNVLFFRTSIDPQRSMMTTLVGSQRSFVSEDLHVFFDDLRDILDSMWTVLENLQQVVSGLFDVNETLLAHKTNEIVTIFTAVTVVLMPATLLAGIYGMNVTWLPFVGNSGAVAAIFVVISLVSALLAMLLIRKQR